MPPAFNLSQDQTLQLMSLKLRSYASNSLDLPSRALDEHKTADGQIPKDPTALASCEHQVCWTHPGPGPAPVPKDEHPPRPRVTLTPAPTPIGCELLKSRPVR